MDGLPPTALLIASFCVSAGLLAQPSQMAGGTQPDASRLVVLGDRLLSYEIRSGYAVTQGDILLGTAAEMEQASKGVANRTRDAATSIFGSGLPSLWTNATVPYLIDPAVPDPARILSAVAHWNERTPLRVVPRTSEVNYVRFVRHTADDVCASFVGMRGSEQALFVTDTCSIGSLIHEIGHVFGIEHEHSRPDRNASVTLLWENIDPRYIRFFDQDAFPSRAAGYYDYDSIMHYRFSAFSINNQPTIETVPVGIPIDQPSQLSPGDVDGATRLYGFVPDSTTIATIPSGLPIVVDDVETTAPRSFRWTPGSRHTISVPAETGADPLHRFVRWSDGGAGRHEITAGPDQTVFAAVFQRLRNVSTRVASGNGTATLAPLGSGMYPERLPVRITAAPAENSTFFRWTGEQPGLRSGLGFSEAQRTGLVPPLSSEFQANFVTSRLTLIASEPNGLMVSVDGVAYQTPMKFQWIPGSEHTLLAQPSQLRFGDSVQFRYLSWSDGGAASHTVNAGAGDGSYTARFMPRYRLTTLAAGTAGTISVSPASSDGFYDAGATVEIKANVVSGGFRYWLGDLSGGGATRTLRMDGVRQVVGYFGAPFVATPYNAASFQVDPAPNFVSPSLAPGEILTIFPDAPLGPPNLVGVQVANGRLATSLAGVRVLFDGEPAPLIYVAPNQLSAIVPASVAGLSESVVRIERGGQVGRGQGFSVVDTFPSIFTANSSGTGQVAAFNQDGTLNSAAQGAPPGSVIVLFATGAGEWERSVPDGQIMDNNLVRPRAPVYLRIGRLPAQVLYAGSAPGLVNGVLQVNAIVPPEALADPAAYIQLIAGNYSSPPGTTISVK